MKVRGHNDRDLFQSSRTQRTRSVPTLQHHHRHPDMRSWAWRTRSVNNPTSQFWLLTGNQTVPYIY